MHHDPAKNVLHLNQTLEELAAEAGQSLNVLRSLLASCPPHAACGPRPAPHALHRPHPLHGLERHGVSAYLETARVLRMDAARDFALLTLDRLLSEAWDGESDSQPRHRLWRQAPRSQTGSRFPARSTTTPLQFTPASTPGSRPAK
jgi:hypothetical protein